METWQFVLGLVTIILTLIAGAWAVSWKISDIKDGLVSQIVATNNTLLTYIQTTEGALEGKLVDVVQKFDNRTREMERDLAAFKTYSEKEFMSKATFNGIMLAQSAERNAMRAELIDRLNRLDMKLSDGFKKEP